MGDGWILTPQPLAFCCCSFLKISHETSATYRFHICHVEVHPNGPRSRRLIYTSYSGGCSNYTSRLGIIAQSGLPYLQDIAYPAFTRANWMAKLLLGVGISSVPFSRANFNLFQSDYAGRISSRFTCDHGECNLMGLCINSLWFFCDLLYRYL